jgi:hypothetical protein
VDNSNEGFLKNTDFTLNKRDITPKVSGDTVREKMEAAIKFKDAAVIGQAMVAVQTLDSNWDMPAFERLFRELGNEIYLLAAMAHLCPTGQRPVDFRTGKQTAHWLWICVNGAVEASDTMKQFGLGTYEDNFENLKDTGILTTGDAA